jgi:cytochrome c5
VLAYLDANFGPGQRLPPAKPTALPAGPGKELVETRCTMCHDLERVTAAKRQKSEWESVVANMLERFGLQAPGEARAIVAYLEANYGQ